VTKRIDIQSKKINLTFHFSKMVSDFPMTYLKAADEFVRPNSPLWVL